MSKWISRIFLLTALLSVGLFLSSLPVLHAQQQKEAQTKPQVQQEQAIPLQILPKDNAGNVDWVKSLRQGIIKPKDSLDPKKPTTPVIDLDIIFKVKGDLPDVVYPHSHERASLSCTKSKIWRARYFLSPKNTTMKKIEE